MPTFVLSRPVFRSYNPVDERLKLEIRARVQPEDSETCGVRWPLLRPVWNVAVEKEVKEQIEQAQQIEPIESIVSEVGRISERVWNTRGSPQDLNVLAPRKQDWDLKRDLNKKLERLERRTQRAILELIRNFSQLARKVVQNATFAPDERIAKEKPETELVGTLYAAYQQGKAGQFQEAQEWTDALPFYCISLSPM